MVYVELGRFRALSIAAIVCSVTGCVFICVSMATEHWQDVSVDRRALLNIAQYKPELLDAMRGSFLYYDRSRGLFYSCHKSDKELKDPLITDAGYICEEDIAFLADEIPKNETIASDSLFKDKMTTRNRLVISDVSLLLVAVVATIVTLLCAVPGFVRRQRLLILISQVSAFLATLVIGTSMAIFHGVDYLEKKKIPSTRFPAFWMTEPSHRELKSNTKISLGYSYVLGWVSMVLALMSAILLVQAGIRLRILESLAQSQVMSSTTSIYSRDQFNLQKAPSGPIFREPPRDKHMHPAFRNKAYDMMDAPSEENISDSLSTQSPVWTSSSEQFE